MYRLGLAQEGKVRLTFILTHLVTLTLTVILTLTLKSSNAPGSAQFQYIMRIMMPLVGGFSCSDSTDGKGAER